MIRGYEALQGFGRSGLFLRQQIIFPTPLYPLSQIMLPVTIVISHYLVYSFNVKTSAVSDTVFVSFIHAPSC